MIRLQFRKRARRSTSAASSANSYFTEALESRVFLSTSVLTYHNDTNSDGLNSSEVQLTPANVTTGSFGKIYADTVDGNVYAQPLVDTGVTVEGAVHSVVFVATENDSLYCIDSGTGAVLWQRSFLTLTDSNGILNNPLGATLISPVATADVNSSDITPNIGITGTPVIDSTQNLIFLVANTKEVVGGTTTFVQRVHAINIANGTDATTPFVIGQTVGANTNTTPIYVYGNGAGDVTDPYNGTGKSVVQFNARTENQRAALSLVNNTLYVSWASHGDNGPYHGWVATWNVANLAANGFTLSGVLNTCPNNSESGIWQGGGSLVFEPDGSAFYFLTGNGSGGASNVAGSNGLPTNANYNESLVKAELDSTTTATNQGPNGWGIKVVDFFQPYNWSALDGSDSDFGSGAPSLIPTPITINGVATNVIAVGGKDGRIFLLNRNNLGHTNTSGDPQVLDAITTSSGIVDAPEEDTGTLSAPAWYNNDLYIISGYSGAASEYSISSTGKLVSVSQTSGTFGYEPGSPSISSNGTNDGIVWLMDRNLNELHAYDASSLNTELWNSSQASGSADAPGALTKFSVPTVANGQVFLGTTDSLVAYGLTPPAASVSNAPVLSAAALSGTAVNLTWTDSSVSPNRAGVYLIQDSTDDVKFNQVATAPVAATSIGIGGLSPQTTYYFRIIGENDIGDSAPSNTADVLTPAQGAAISYPNGFASAAPAFSLNGNDAISGSDLELTNGKGQEDSSAFYNTLVSVSGFTTQFTFQIGSGDTTTLADGFTFTLQDSSPAALGAYEGGLGYQGISNSVAIKFDVYNNNGEGTDSTGLFSGGAAPTDPGAVDLSSTGINLAKNDPILANLSYNGATLTVMLTDTVTKATATQTYTVNIPALIGSSAAYAGFTGSTGGYTAVQNIVNWTYTSTAAAGSSPNAPSGLGATPATATSVALNWTNNALNQTGYYLDRATDPAFTQNLITETLPASPSSFTDTATGLAPGGIYYYQISAFNAVGSSSYSNPASVTIPMSPPRATDQMVTGVTANSISMSWQDNAGHLAEGYNILRATNGGSFSIVTSLPPTSRQAPSTYAWTDNTVTPGNYYEYHIEAYNSSGYNDFAGVNATTLAAAPNGVSAVQGSSGVTVSWTPVTAYGTITYNVYRSTTLGGEGSTPLYTGITGSSYLDTAAPPGVPYYYTVTAVNGNDSYTPPLPSESAPSAEASTATPVKLTGTASANTTLSYNNDGGTYLNAFDGNTSTFFDAPAASGNWVQLAFSSPATITQIAYAPRAKFESRMDGGVFEASNDPTFTTGVVTLYTIPTTGAPADGLTTRSVSVTGTYQYVRYVSPANSYGNIAEMQVFGTSASAVVTSTTPTVISGPTASVNSSGVTAALAVTASESGNPALTYTWSTTSLPAGVSDNLGFSSSNGTTTGNDITATFSDAGTYGLNVTITDPSGNSTVVPLSVTVNQVLTEIDITPNGSPVSVAQGATRNFATNTSSEDQFGNDMNTQPALTWAILSGGGSINPTTGVYTASGTVGSKATVTATAPGASGAIIGSVSVTTIASSTGSGSTQLTGTTSANTTLAYNNNGDTYLLAFDGNTSTYFDAPNPSGNWIQLAFASPQTITSIAYAPRAGYESRMKYGVFEASNDPNFVTGVVTLYSVSASPADGLTIVPVTATGSYQYVRYVSPGSSYGNIAEMQVFGTGGTTTTAKPVVSSGPTATVSAAGTTAALAVAASETGNPALTYTWSVASVPTGVTTAPTFSSTNGTTSGTAVTASFAAAGTYGLNITITDSSGNSTVAPLSVVVTQVLTGITISPSTSPVSVVAGGSQAFTANALDQFGKALATQPTFTWALANGGTGSISATGVYTAPATVGSTATVTATSGAIVSSVSVKSVAAATNGQLTGTYSASTTLSYNNDGETYLNVFDGNTSTYFDAPTTNGNWVQINFGAAHTITSINFAPRVGYESRMKYGVFEASNDPTFTTGVVTLYTITTPVVDGLNNSLTIAASGTYQYVRYLSPANSYGNIAEIKVFGV